MKKYLVGLGIGIIATIAGNGIFAATTIGDKTYTADPASTEKEEDIVVSVAKIQTITQTKRQLTDDIALLDEQIAGLQSRRAKLVTELENMQQELDKI